MVLNVRHYWILDLTNHLCLNHIICIAKHFICYLNLLQKTQRIQVGNRQYVSILFVIPTIVDIHGHRFKMYTLISKKHENVDTVLGIKIYLN